MVDLLVHDGVLQLAATGTEWLSTGWAGGRTVADAAYNCTVPDGWDRTDLDRYIETRRAEAGFEPPGPTLLTGVEMCHARCGRVSVDRDDERDEDVDVLAVATAGVSNPAALFPAVDAAPDDVDGPDERPTEPGTVNLLVHVDQPLTEGALATLVAVVAEAKTATLLRETGFPGTTTDAVIVGARGLDEDTEPVRFTGSGTPVGSAVRICVRDALRASLDARYAETEYPESVEAAAYGVVPETSASVFRPTDRD